MNKQQQEQPVRTTPDQDWRQRAASILEEQAQGLAAAAVLATLRAASIPSQPSDVREGMWLAAKDWAS